jgi:hypothetical protein
MPRDRIMRAIAFAGILLAHPAMTQPSMAQAGAVVAQCANMKDPIGCTCAVATGGNVSGNTWARGRGDDRVAYDACIAERGRAPVRLPQIPARH